MAADILGRKYFYRAVFESCGPEFGHLATVTKIQLMMVALLKYYEGLSDFKIYYCKIIAHLSEGSGRLHCLPGHRVHKGRNDAGILYDNALQCRRLSL